MRKTIYRLLLGALWLTACGRPAVTTRPETVGSGGVTPTSVQTLAPTSAAPTETRLREIKADFVATDPGTVQLAAGKPQLVEFFAVW